jgi:hypothetical protein
VGAFSAESYFFATKFDFKVGPEQSRGNLEAGDEKPVLPSVQLLHFKVPRTGLPDGIHICLLKIQLW